ncbi:HNH endonuclease [Bacillus phage DIGNKC]|uniref:HNH endonuclease n=1 Tax=Bacillus phage DIGNKC TaxID=1805948 RepID=UPI0007A7715E|nr:HNH endonuclease [Bacillus phage DIGNKC]AMW62697.1 HNH endonuclease [Bacillus phage DIGNKC]
MENSQSLNDELVGKRFKSNSSNNFTVIGISKERQNRMKMYDIEFDEINGVSYRMSARKETILKGGPVNRFFPSVYGIGYMGLSSSKENRTAYDRWHNMISRCYNEKSHRFSSYGAIGVTVCDRWLNFSNYLEDFTKIDGYDKDNLNNLEIDKDTKVRGNKVYSLETCRFITKEENTKEQNERNNQPWFIAESPDGDVYESNNQHEFAEEHSIKNKGISSVLRGTQKTHRGWKFKYK